MSDTPVDIAKVTQMLDAGWAVSIYRSGANSRPGMGGYVVYANHVNLAVWHRAKAAWRELLLGSNPDITNENLEMLMEADWDDEGVVHTEDFTPAQALTRMAYKVHGQLPPTKGGET